MTPMIAVDRLSKQYRLGSRRRGEYSTLRDTLAQAAGAAWRRLRAPRRPAGADGPRTLWALKDVSLEVPAGEVVGIIGHNGAGKSTLLKILSRIVEPTSGRAAVRGRLGSLLEVGTGFHPELTGRENIYLNGAILNMGRREIDRKFDAIVDFAEIADFIDTPVKRYSSGMYVRLGFAVAAHMTPDILLVDEVLAVGDMKFQRKCMEHAKHLRDNNATVVIVSHNMFSIKAMCTRVVYMSHGQVVYDGSPEGAIALYEKDSRLATPA
ncbi:MAG TPA: ABC transporter ATP-binding protein, partial [Gemmataceae bacterium]